MTTISANIIADSISPVGIRLTTMHLRYPRFIHAEFMTHRVFSRNARSSRAVPVETMLAEIERDPVIPLHWGANQKGMQADRECTEQVPLPGPNSLRSDPPEMWSREEAWLYARDEAVKHARGFHAAGYHKQVVNRILEPFMHIDTLVSATEYKNFLALRDHPAAEPHIRLLAQEMKAALAGSKPCPLSVGDWHLPFISTVDVHEVESFTMKEAGFDASDRLADRSLIAPRMRKVLVALSVARCARISYRPFDGGSSIEAEITRHDALVGASPMHASPAEHQATPDQRRANGVGSYDGWRSSHEHGNFHGWRQYRKTLHGESLAGAAA